MDKTKTDIIRKIKGLLELAANNPESNESKLASEKAGKLMAQYNISYIKEDIKNSNLLKTVDTPIYMERNMLWEHILITDLANTFDCRAIKSNIALFPGESIKEFTIIGFTVDVDLCSWYFKYLRVVISRKGEDKYNKIKERKSYQLGLVHNISIRLKELRNSKEKHTDSTTKDLVVAKHHEVADYYKKLFPKVKENKTNPNIDPIAYTKGRIDGKNISLSRPIAKTPDGHCTINGKTALY
jgi:hypothetical protein